ncbi:MAG: beta-eliminating lyase-related protein, partial [Myxococcota bacterium]
MILHEPYKIKSVRNIPFTTIYERKKILREHFYNITLIPSGKVTFDMTTQGTSAMTQEQVSALFVGDEAYAGAVNFYHLEKAVADIFGLKFTCPTHNKYGNLKLLTSIFVKEGKMAASNTIFPKELIEYYKGEFFKIKSKVENGISRLDITDIKQLSDRKGQLAYIYIDLRSDEGIAVDINDIQEICRLLKDSGIPFIIDASNIVLWANVIKNSNTALSSKPISEIIKETAALSTTVVVDAGQDIKSNVGGFIATNNPKFHEAHQNEVVIYEGLHTYGGMAGRTMEVVAVGLRDMIVENDVIWYHQQIELLSNLLKENGVAHYKGIDGIYLETDKILNHIKENRVHTLAAALYLKSGIRAHIGGRYLDSEILPILLPRRALLNTQVAQIAEAIIELCKEATVITPLMLTNKPLYHNEAVFDWLLPIIKPYEFTCEPYIIHSIERIAMKSIEERRKAIEDAGYNTFLLKMEDVTIDLLTDSGTAAMSVEQWRAYLGAQETPNTSDAYLDLVETAQRIYGYKYIILTHQGRAAEHIMSQMFIRPGDYVPGNMYFTTTKQHQEMAGGIFVDVIVDEANDTESEFEWKGNVDMKKLADIYDKAKSEGKRLAYISFEFNVNLAGGQPVSMDNMKAVYEFCKPRGIPVFFDATRC